MALSDFISRIWDQAGNQVGASATGGKMGLPPLQGAFEDYGPWGAGGGKLGAGAFPQSPDVTGPLMPSAPAAQAGAPSPKFNALLDPNRGGFLSFIGAATGAPTRAEWERQQAGAGANAAYAGLSERMKTMSPQAAILDFVKTPEGQQWFMHAADPIGDIKQIVGQLVPPTPDPYTLNAGDTRFGPDNKPVASMPPKPETTTAMTEYNQIYVPQEKAAGRTPKSFDEWKASHERMTAQQTSAVTKSGKVIAPDWVKQQVDLTNGVSSAQQTVDLLTQFEGLLNSNDTGAMQAMEQPVKGLLVSMGLASEDMAKKVGAMGVLEGLGNQLALLARQGGFTQSDKIGLTGNTSDRDLSFLIKSVPNIWNTSLANKGLIIILRAQARRKATIDYLKAEYISGDAPGQTTDGGNLNGFHEYLDAQLKPGGSLDGNFLTPEEQKTLLDLNGKAAGMPPRQQQPGVVEGGAKTTPKQDRAEPTLPVPDDFLKTEKDQTLRHDAWTIYQRDNPGLIKKRMGQ